MAHLDEQKVARLLRVARGDTEITLALLAERFNMTKSAVGRILNKHGVYRSPDYFSAMVNRKRKLG